MGSVKDGIDALKAGKTILFPTDTIWGIGCDATNEEAVQQIIKIKNRAENKSFVILVNNFNMLERYIEEFPEVCYDLIDLSEKPLSIVYDNPNGLAPSVVAGDNSVAIRLTNDKICSQLIQSIRKPIVATSANISGAPFPTSFDTVSAEIKSAVDCIVEERTQEKLNKPSQIIKIDRSSNIKVIRK